eukprot:jgi/Undpi1/3264/HiC_scaffold_15.g06638.m1
MFILMYQLGCYVGQQTVFYGIGRGVRRIGQSGLRAVWPVVTPHIAIGRSVPVSAMSSKLEAAAAKTVVADTAVHDGIIGEMVGERDQETSVSQLLPGGLDAKFWQNPWLEGTPTIHRVDTEVSFNWGLSPVTSFGPGPVSARWTGKLLAPATETFNVFVRAQGGVRVFLDHDLVIDAWQENLRAAKERMVLANLVEGTYHDIVVEFKEEGGYSSIQMMWKSATVAPSLIPASALFYATPISRSFSNTTITPRGDGPLHGEGLSRVPTGEKSPITGQEKVWAARNWN